MGDSVDLTREQAERLFSLDEDAITVLRALLNDDRHLLHWDEVTREWTIRLRQ